MFPQPKKKRKVNETYLCSVRSSGCVVCNNPIVDAHHCGTLANSGMGIKVDDYYTVALCRKCHQELHQTGEISFQKKHNISFKDLVIKNLIKYINENKGEEND